MTTRTKFKFPMKMYPYTFSGEQSLQALGEFSSLLKFVKENNIRSYLEIGAARGDIREETFLKNINE